MSQKQSPEFDQFAKNYSDDLKNSMPAFLEEEEYFAGYKVRHVARAMNDQKVNRILDYGCGIGRSLSIFKDCFPDAELWGFDVSPESISIAREGGGLESAILTSDPSELQPSAFDIVFIANVIHHVTPEERVGFLEKCKSLLSSSGKLFIFEHNPFNPLTRIVFERCPYDSEASMVSRGQMHAYLHRAGLEVLDSCYTLFFPKPLSGLRGVERFLGKVPLGAQYCVMCR